jgi:hypothetical protein
MAAAGGSLDEDDRNDFAVIRVLTDAWILKLSPDKSHYRTSGFQVSGYGAYKESMQKHRKLGQRFAFDRMAEIISLSNPKNEFEAYGLRKYILPQGNAN